MEQSVYRPADCAEAGGQGDVDEGAGGEEEGERGRFVPLRPKVH